MALTAREWLLLPEEEQKRRRNELSPHECFLLRTDFAYIHFTEDEKNNMSEQQKYQFIHPKEHTNEEKNAFNKKAEDIFGRLMREASHTTQ